MSGQESAAGYPRPGYNPDSYRSYRYAFPDVRSGGAERVSDKRLRDAAPGSDRSSSVGAAQQRWPEYNRVVIAGTAVAGTAALIAAAVVQVVVK